MIHQISIRILCLTGALFLSVSSLLAQSAEEEVIRLKQQTGEVATDEEKAADEASRRLVTGYKAEPGHWNLSVGTSFSYMKGYGSGMMLYAAPSYTLALNDRWSLHGGLVASRYQNVHSVWPGEDPWPGSFNSLALFMAASYRMNDRLVLHGTGYKQLLSVPLTPFTPYPVDDYSLGATYKIGENITIGASVHMRNGLGYYPTPFGSPLYPSPFGW